jgi:hypothetical protein
LLIDTLIFKVIWLFILEHRMTGLGGFQDAGATRVGATANTGLSTPNSAVIQTTDGWGSNAGVSKSKESGAIISQLWSSRMDRKRGRPLGSKSKRLRLDSIDSMLLKSNWEEVQELLRPAPSATSTVITIDGHEFEEYSVVIIILLP